MFFADIEKNENERRGMACVFIKYERTKIKALKADVRLTVRKDEVYTENLSSFVVDFPFLKTF